MPPVETAVAGHEPIEHRFNETLDRQWFLKAHRLGVRTRIIGKHSVCRCADFESKLDGFVIFNGAEPQFQIVRASSRERGCQYVLISVVAVSIKKKKQLYLNQTQ